MMPVSTAPGVVAAAKDHLAPLGWCGQCATVLVATSDRLCTYCAKQLFLIQNPHYQINPTSMWDYNNFIDALLQLVTRYSPIERQVVCQQIRAALVGQQIALPNQFLNPALHGEFVLQYIFQHAPMLAAQYRIQICSIKNNSIVSEDVQLGLASYIPLLIWRNNDVHFEPIIPRPPTMEPYYAPMPAVTTAISSAALPSANAIPDLSRMLSGELTDGILFDYSLRDSASCRSCSSSSSLNIPFSAHLCCPCAESSILKKTPADPVCLLCKRQPCAPNYASCRACTITILGVIIGKIETTFKAMTILRSKTSYDKARNRTMDAEIGDLFRFKSGIQQRISAFDAKPKPDPKNCVVCKKCDHAFDLSTGIEFCPTPKCGAKLPPKRSA
jgi:hypothetical protein